MSRTRRIGRELSTSIIALASVAVVPLTALAGDGARQMTLHPAHDWGPAWSPDGTRIAFYSLRYLAGIWVVRPPGGAAGMYDAVAPDGPLGRFAFDTAVRMGDGAQPTWSPDSQQIAFVSSGSGNADIWVKPAQMGGSATQVTFDPATDTYPAWSPDGSRIAFSSSRVGDWQNYHIWVIPAAGGTATQLTFSPELELSPAWSPDGNQIAFDVQYAPEPLNGIWVVPAGGGTATQLTSEGWSPDWSPDGSRIAFASGGDIWVIPSTGGSAAQLTFDPSDDGDPSWFPDGSQIAYVSDRRGNKDICVIDVEPAVSGHRQLSTAPESWGSIKGRYRQ